MILDNNTYENVRYTFNFEVLCSYNDFPFIHSNVNTKYFPGDYILH